MVVTPTHKVVVPGALCGHHEKPEEAIRQEHLYALVVRRQVAFWVVPLVRVLPTPLITARGQFVGFRLQEPGVKLEHTTQAMQLLLPQTDG